MKSSADKSPILAWVSCFCGFPSINGINTPVTNTVEHLEPQYSSSYNFHERTHLQNAVASRAATVILRAFVTEDCKIGTFIPQTRPHIKYYPNIFRLMLGVDRRAIASVQQKSAGNFLLQAPRGILYMYFHHLLPHFLGPFMPIFSLSPYLRLWISPDHHRKRRLTAETPQCGLKNFNAPLDGPTLSRHTLVLNISSLRTL